MKAGDQVIWTGAAGLFSHPVTIVAVRNVYLTIFGEGPGDGVTVYDIADPGIRGTVLGIPGEQLHPATH